MRAAGLTHEAYTTKLELRIVMLCSMAGTLMQALDSTIANVALPYMQGSLSASRDQITWVLTSYIVAAAIMTAPVGWIAARFGRKNFAIVSLTGFTVASMMCGAAQTLDQMIIFRLVQGAFGAALAPLSQSIMLDLYPASKRGTVMAIWGMGVMVGPILGPTLGGYLTDAYDWRWVFYVNLPFGIAAVTGISLFLRDTHRDESLKFDWFGFAMLGIGLAALQLMLDRGTTKDWFSSSEIVIYALLAGLGLYLFVVHILTTQKSFMPREIFKDRNFVTALFLMLLVSLIMLASSALLPPYLENLAGYSVTQTGLLMAPRGIGTMLSMVFAGRLAMRLDARHVMAVGTALLLWSLWEMSHWTPGVAAWWLCFVSFVQGIGMGLIFVPMNLIAFATLAPALRTDGSALFNLMRNVGSAVGVSITTTMLANSIQTMHAQLAGNVSPFNRALSVNAPSMMWNPNLPFGLAQLDSIVQYNAQIIAYANDFLFMFFISLPALFVLFFMRQPALLQKPPEIEVME
ncbi:MAG TPA: DHA2 family efflux MFS transporter permease subunit [Rhizomicrobium sp.]|jgi:DHA2 family multidrug resistance protein|nr:DHA2 family efflux MFS transporter permease subunit [Rhizomicrobium sp.]